MLRRGVEEEPVTPAAAKARWRIYIHWLRPTPPPRLPLVGSFILSGIQIPVAASGGMVWLPLWYCVMELCFS